MIPRAATTKKARAFRLGPVGRLPALLFLVLFFCFIIYPYTIIGIMVDVKMTTTTAIIVGFDTTAKIVYIIVKSYLGE